MDGRDFTDPSRIEVNRSEKSLADALPSPMFGRYDPRPVDFVGLLSFPAKQMSSDGQKTEVQTEDENA
jgi:hypothetical protein